MNEIIRPLVIPDVETTGLDKQVDSIIQLSALKVDRQTGNIIDSINFYIRPDRPYTITIQAYLKHRIKPDFLADKPTFRDVAPQVRAFFKGCDILTYNGIAFDLPFIKIEFQRIGEGIDFMNVNCYDAFLEEKRRNGNNLEATFKRYTGKSMEESGLKAHDALSDVKATWEVFKAQQEKQAYEPEKRLTEDNFIVLGEFNGNPTPVFAVGKYKDLPVSYVSAVDKGYLSWCVSSSTSFPQSTKDYIRQYMQ